VKTASYEMPVAQDNLQIMYEYALEEGKWKSLSVNDSTSMFTQEGSISFKIEEDFNSIVLNGQEGYWIRVKIISGNYGQEELSVYDKQTGEVKVTPATLAPPIFSKIRLSYSQQRVDLNACVSLSNYQYQNISFDKNRPVLFFKQENESQEAMYFGFDSYLSEQKLELFFDIDTKEGEYCSQRVLEWEILSEGTWKRLRVVDDTQGLSRSGDVKLSLPEIKSLEAYSLYIDTFTRMWIRGSVNANTLKSFAKINQVLLNTVEVHQGESFYNELLGHSNGLPNMSYKLQHKNLTAAPIISIDGHEYKEVERFIDCGKEDKVFRFNGIRGEIEFGDGTFGEVPSLGSEIYAKQYSVCVGKEGNLSTNKVKVLGDAINYIDSVENIFISSKGQDGDSIEELKRFAPSVLKSMQRAVTFDDYEHLCLGFSGQVQKAKALMHDNELVILVMSASILKEKGFINQGFLKKLQVHLEDLSMVGLHPRVEAVKLCQIRLKLKIKYLNEDEVMQRSKLESELFYKAQEYLHPLKGLDGNGYEIGRKLLKSDVVKILNSIGGSYILSELSFVKDGINIDANSVEIGFNEVLDVHDLIVEELNYDL